MSVPRRTHTAGFDTAPRPEDYNVEYQLRVSISEEPFEYGRHEYSMAGAEDE